MQLVSVQFGFTGCLSEDIAVFVPKAEWGTEYPSTQTARVSNVITHKDPA